jgi:hypothetical protein
MKRYLAMLIVFAFATTIVCAEGKAASEATDITLTGKLEKKVGTGDKAKVSYVLDTKDYSKVELPKTEVKLDELVGQEVEMVVKGVARVNKEGKNRVKVTAVVSVKKVEAPKATTETPKAPEAPAAPAVPPTPAK